MSKIIKGGIFNRAIGLLKTIEGIHHVPSDEEVEGLLKLLPAETQENIGAIFEPHVREVGVVFFQMLKAWAFQARDARAEGKKIILVPFNFPPELVLAFENAVPLTSEVLTTLAAVALEGGGERYWDHMMGMGLPDHICSSSSIEIGSVITGEDLIPDAIISAAPGACDANAKIHEFLAQYYQIPQFVLEKLVDDTPEGRAQYSVYFRRLVADLETFLGERLDEDRVRALLEKANRCTELYWQLHEMRKLRPCPLPNLFHVFLLPIRFCMWGTDEAIETFEAMIRVARRRIAEGSPTPSQERVRALWAYTAFYFNLAQLHAWMEKQGYAFLADALSLFMPRPIDLSSLETMIEGMATTAWEYPMNRQMGSSSMSRVWVEDMVFMARDLHADCVLYSGHDACKQTWSVVSILREELLKRVGVPLLILHGDSWMKTTTPITVIQSEIDEFMGNVLRRRKGQQRVRRRRRPEERIPGAG